jgi:predicted nucleic-acid-binding protein
MASKVFADANLLLDFTLQRANYATARQVIQHAIDTDIQLFTTPAALHITSYYTGRFFTGPQTKQIILTLLNDVQIIDCDHATALIAVNSPIADIEDALQYYTALKFGLDCFISGDKNLKKAAMPQLPVYTAAELLATLNQPQ